MIVNLLFAPLDRAERTISTICMSQLLGHTNGSWKVIPITGGLIVRLHAESLERAKSELTMGWGERLELLVQVESEADGSTEMWSEIKAFFKLDAGTYTSLEDKLVSVELSHVW